MSSTIFTRTVLRIAIISGALFSLIINPACADRTAESGKVIIFHAGSLSVPFSRMKKEFEAEHRGVEVLLEASGSIRAARKISDLKKPCDIIASADANVIDTYLVPAHADCSIRFASNQIVLCYTSDSRYARDISQKNWYSVLRKSDVAWGHSDPNLDPCGYRALMVLQLAETYYREPGLYAGLMANRPVEHVRPKSVELLSLLQTRNLDYAWEYRSVAIQHGLRYLSLPDEINLGDHRFDSRYATATVSVAGKSPGTMNVIKGESCTYGVALVKDAPNPAAAVAFLRYMLDPRKGLAIFRDAGQPPITPCRVRDENAMRNLPRPLQKYVTVGR